MDSIWNKTCKREKRPALAGETRADVAVIGGGITGILTAWQLEQAGIHTVILEADQIGGGQTKNTTAKITSQHGMFCHRFLEKKGEEKARNYVQVNQEAVKEYNRIIMEEGIDCDLTECASYVYSSDGEKLRKETEAARKLGINASFEAHIEIPVSCAGAVIFPHQAAFHPLKFLEALARNLTVYEDTMVTEVRGHQVKTSCGSVRADKIIFAAHFPFINFPGMYFARMHQERSYVIALETEERLKGIYIGDGKETFSFRQYDKYLLLGGQAHRTGENPTGGQYEKLKKAAEEIYSQSQVTACWSAQIIKDSGKAVKGLTKRFFHMPEETADRLLRGHGAMADTPQGKAGVYKTEEGKLCQVNIVCPHMGCELNWNPEELTWDCPCHGSRFDREGNLIDGPAKEGICHG